MKLLSIDCESNGLYGEVFAVSMIVRDGSTTISEFTGRCPIEGPVDPWVQENVLPVLEDMPINYESGLHMRSAFWKFWMQYKNFGPIIAHMGAPVETDFFRRCITDWPHEFEARMWYGPFPLHDVATALLLAGEDPASVDAYVAKHGIAVPNCGSTHHPKYDAEAAAIVWEHLAKSKTQPFDIIRHIDGYQVVFVGSLTKNTKSVTLYGPLNMTEAEAQRTGAALYRIFDDAIESGFFDEFPKIVYISAEGQRVYNEAYATTQFKQHPHSTDTQGVYFVQKYNMHYVVDDTPCKL